MFNTSFPLELAIKKERGDSMFTNIMDIIKKRRSIRNYNKEKVSTEVIMELLEGAVYAPTGSNIQPWYFVVVNDERINKQLKKS